MLHSQSDTVSAQEMQQALSTLGVKLQNRDQLAMATGFFARAQGVHKEAGSGDGAQLAQLCMARCVRSSPVATQQLRLCCLCRKTGAVASVKQSSSQSCLHCTTTARTSDESLLNE